MLKEERAKMELEVERSCLYEKLYQGVASMDIHSMERLCRRINIIIFKIHTFKGGRYDKE